MQINSVNNYTNANFKGQIILKNAKSHAYGQPTVDFMSVNSELIEQIIFSI